MTDRQVPHPLCRQAHQHSDDPGTHCMYSALFGCTRRLGAAGIGLTRATQRQERLAGAATSTPSSHRRRRDRGSRLTPGTVPADGGRRANHSWAAAEARSRVRAASRCVFQSLLRRQLRDVAGIAVYYMLHLRGQIHQTSQVVIQHTR